MMLVSSILKRISLRRKRLSRIGRHPSKDDTVSAIACAKIMANESWVGVGLNVIDMAYMGSHTWTQEKLIYEPRFMPQERIQHERPEHFVEFPVYYIEDSDKMFTRSPSNNAMSFDARNSRQSRSADFQQK